MISSLARPALMLCLACCCPAGPLVGPSLGSAQTLQSLREEVREPKEEKEEAPRKRREKRRDNDDDLEIPFLGEFLLLGMIYPYWAPIDILDDHYSDRGYFTCYPYAEGTHGSMMIEPFIESHPYTHLLRTSVEYVDETETVSRISSHVLLDTTTRFGIDAQWDYRMEDLQSGGNDDLHSGDFNLVFRFAQDESAQLRSGLGFNWLSDDVGTNLGFNFTYGGDLFLVKPWITSAEIDWGRLGNSELFRGRCTVGAQWRGVELYTGYEYYDVGSVQLDGLISGVRFWY